MKEDGASTSSTGLAMNQAPAGLGHSVAIPSAFMLRLSEYRRDLVGEIEFWARGEPVDESTARIWALDYALRAFDAMFFNSMEDATAQAEDAAKYPWQPWLDRLNDPQGDRSPEGQDGEAGLVHESPGPPQEDAPTPCSSEETPTHAR